MLEILERIVDGKGEMSDLDELEELATMVQSMALCGDKRFHSRRHNQSNLLLNYS